MTGDPKNMSCQEFQERLAELIGSGEDAASHPHLQTCANCRAFLADLQAIADAARQLLLEEPDENLWDRIEMSIKNEEGSAKVD
jgi:hypothetical protein